MTTPRAVALGFVEGTSALDELRQRVNAGHHRFAIMLGVGLSMKSIRLKNATTWHIVNGIDDTTQDLTDEGLWSQSNIGEALDKCALLDMDGDRGLIKVKDRGMVDAEAFLAETTQTREQWEAAHTQADPLSFTLNASPGAIRMGTTTRAEWQPADPELVIEVMDIGPATVAQIDLGAVSFGHHDGSGKRGATTSIELTIEDIDGIVATLLAIKQDAIDNRHFQQRADGWWTNGMENE